MRQEEQGKRCNEIKTQRRERRKGGQRRGEWIGGIGPNNSLFLSHVLVWIPLHVIRAANQQLLLLRHAAPCRPTAAADTHTLSTVLQALKGPGGFCDMQLHLFKSSHLSVTQKTRKICEKSHFGLEKSLNLHLQTEYGLFDLAFYLRFFSVAWTVSKLTIHFTVQFASSEKAFLAKPT